MAEGQPAYNTNGNWSAVSTVKAMPSVWRIALGIYFCFAGLIMTIEAWGPADPKVELLTGILGVVMIVIPVVVLYMYVKQ